MDCFPEPSPGDTYSHRPEVARALCHWDVLPCIPVWYYLIHHHVNGTHQTQSIQMAITTLAY